MEYSMAVQVCGALKREFDDKAPEYDLFILKQQFANPTCRGMLPFKLKCSQETFETLADDADYPISGWIKIRKILVDNHLTEKVVEIRMPSLTERSLETAMH